MQVSGESTCGTDRNPCWVRTPEENEILLQQLIENWQRSDLNPYELADSLAILRDANGYNQQQLAKATGKSKGEISKVLSLLDLPVEVQSLTRNDATKRITRRHLYALRPFEEHQQKQFLSKIQQGVYTAEKIENLYQRKQQEVNRDQNSQYQRRTFHTKQAIVRFQFLKAEVTEFDLLEALQEVRKMIVNEASE